MQKQQEERAKEGSNTLLLSPLRSAAILQPALTFVFVELLLPEQLTSPRLSPLLPLQQRCSAQAAEAPPLRQDKMKTRKGKKKRRRKTEQRFPFASALCALFWILAAPFSVFHQHQRV